MEATDNGQVVAEKGRSLVMAQGQARRLYRLYARAEATAELANATHRTAEQAQATFVEALSETFELAGVPFEPTDRYQIDWRLGHVLLQEERANG